jgi:dihydropteroate synthase
MTRRVFTLRLPRHTLTLGQRTLLMGVLNVTPDSFYASSRALRPRAAAARALAIERQGADILDIGGESTRPGAEPVPPGEELRRVLSVLLALRGRLRIPISIDTRKSQVAEAALAAGAEIINDVSALHFDPAMAAVIRRHRAAVILMHMRGEPATMQRGPFARDVVEDVFRGLRSALRRARRAGIPPSRVLLDPGLGFGKNYRQNFQLLAALPGLAALGRPVVIGPSRKQFTGCLNPASGILLPASNRLMGTAAAVTASILGGAHVIRVHDVAAMRSVALLADQIALH